MALVHGRALSFLVGSVHPVKLFAVKLSFLSVNDSSGFFFSNDVWPMCNIQLRTRSYYIQPRRLQELAQA